MTSQTTVETWATTTRRFSGWLTLLMVLSYVISNATIGASRSEIAFPTVLLTNLFASITWLLPWVAVVGIVGFFSSWALLQIGRRIRVISWWRSALVALIAAALISVVHFALNAWIDNMASVGYTENGEALEAASRAAHSALFVVLSTLSGIVLSRFRRLTRTEGQATAR